MKILAVLSRLVKIWIKVSRYISYTAIVKQKTVSDIETNNIVLHLSSSMCE